MQESYLDNYDPIEEALKETQQPQPQRPQLPQPTLLEDPNNKPNSAVINEIKNSTLGLDGKDNWKDVSRKTQIGKNYLGKPKHKDTKKRFSIVKINS